MISLKVIGYVVNSVLRPLLLVRSGLNVIRMCLIMCLRIVVIWLI
nr:MAG TPA: hypothetical protein [Caudoviricetes sp.]